MKIRTEHRANRTIAYVAGALDAVGGPVLEQALQALARSKERHVDAPICVDLSAVDYLSSAGITTLLFLLKMPAGGDQAAGGRPMPLVRLVNLSPAVRQLLQTTKILDALERGELGPQPHHAAAAAEGLRPGAPTRAGGVSFARVRARPRRAVRPHDQRGARADRLAQVQPALPRRAREARLRPGPPHATARGDDLRRRDHRPTGRLLAGAGRLRVPANAGERRPADHDPRDRGAGAAHPPDPMRLARRQHEQANETPPSRRRPASRLACGLEHRDG